MLYLSKIVGMSPTFPRAAIKKQLKTTRTNGQFSHSLMIIKTKAPRTMRMAWIKSVQMTADRPPKMVKKAAKARRMRIDR